MGENLKGQLERNANNQEFAGVGSTVTYLVLEDDEVNQVTLVESMHKKFANEVSTKSELWVALLFSREGEDVKVDSPEPYMIRVLHISNPIQRKGPVVKPDKQNIQRTIEIIDLFVPADTANYANYESDMKNGLEVGHAYGTKAIDIYNNGVRYYGWDFSKATSFASQKLLYDKNCTREGYSLWLLPYSNLCNYKNKLANWTNYINSDFNVIKEVWMQIDERFYSDTDERLTFAKQKNGQYIYLGIFQAQECDENSHCKIYKRIDTNYGV